MTIGLTGGIGCGKSSVLPAFEKIGFAVIDTDKIASGIHSDPDFRRFARERFGEDLFDSAGALRRDALAKIVFSDPAALADLEAFMHPRIRAEWKARVAASPARKIAVEVPLLFEKNYESDFDATVCVAASEDVQFSRLEKRGLPRARARERVAAQLPLQEKIRRADFVVFNDGSRGFLDAQAREIDARLSA
ncbi:MAG: dephospho-CoA kinase [Candidatus Spyradosoma sp.]